MHLQSKISRKRKHLRLLQILKNSTV